jgi:hypothetical protein
VGLAGGAVVAVAMIGMGTATAHADDDSTSPQTLDGLLNSAITNLSDASNVLSPDVDDISQLAGYVNADEELAIFADRLLTSENYIDFVANSISQDGSLSDLINQVFFIPLDQSWENDSEAILDAAGTLDAAIAAQAAGVPVAYLDLESAENDALVTAVLSIPVFFVDELLGGGGLGL